MCYAILEISYVSERGTKNVDSEDQLNEVLGELQANTNVIKIKVFRNTEIHSRVSKWQTELLSTE